ncbi:hypothetical protein R3P38DRAFT_3475797 [Favolaschia claudopus]|uniref:Uncharacterized protein n=1 Tax=Favolaschia claudopus TaxID=2862362 RepID=A0AAW0CJU9_9AGAR
MPSTHKVPYPTCTRALANPPITSSDCEMVPQSLLPKSVAAIALAGLFVLHNDAQAVLVNHTIEDFDIAVDYGNCTIHTCDATSSVPNPCHQQSYENQTITIVTPLSEGCSVKVLFNGTAIYSYLYCPALPGCTIEVDNMGQHSEIDQADPATTIPPLGYFNNSLSNQAHILIISSTAEIFMVDKFIYTVDDGISDPLKPVPTAGSSDPTSDGASSIGATSISRSSLTCRAGQSTSAASAFQPLFPSTPSSPSAKQSTTKIAVILGGALGGLLFCAAIIITVLARRIRRCLKTSNRNTNVLQPYPSPATWSSEAYQSTSRRKTRWPLALRISLSSFSSNRQAHPSPPPYRSPEVRDEAQGEVREGVAVSRQGGNDSPPPEYFA